MDNNKVTTRNVVTESGINFILQYYSNEAQIKGYHQQEFARKDCLLCKDIDNKINSTLDHPHYVLDDTTHSLFEGHQLLFAKKHAEEFLTGRVRFLLDFLADHNKHTLAYGGSKNSTIKNFHFTCHVLNEQVELPLKDSCSNPDFYKTISNKKGIEIGELEHYGRGAVVLKSNNEEKLTEQLYELEKHIGVNYANNKHPFINLYLWMEDDQFCIALVPRAVYKPSEYYDENNAWDIPIGVLEMGGLFIMKNHDEFMHTSADFLKKLCDEVSFNDEHIKEIIAHVDQK
ncbi:hypothetical protein [Saccharicrinis aurantiacus]|uniref:hypothetical protein n=1 Tax=Saccharicrinis aurantiacus TaxID=1849719 RepID=UPI00249359E6|nr:hypothetical protein [Saccharicrinis aurantiacus]